MQYTFPFNFARVVLNLIKLTIDSTLRVILRLYSMSLAPSDFQFVVEPPFSFIFHLVFVMLIN